MAAHTARQQDMAATARQQNQQQISGNAQILFCSSSGAADKYDISMIFPTFQRFKAP